MTETLPLGGTALYPLANAKGTALVCELCQKPAFIQCSKCRVTYYCGTEHQTADWQGIHAKICDEVADMRKPLPFLTSEEGRCRRRDEQRDHQLHMINVTRTAGQKLLFEGRFEEAVPAALQSLKFAIEVYGGSSVELVHSYLILGEASIGLNRLSQAEEYLSQAQWTVLKTPECPGSIKSKLYRNLGLLYSAKGNFKMALQNLATDIYHASDEYGTDDVRVSGGYYHMANVFLQSGKEDIAFDLLDRVTCIWYDHLWKIIEVITAPPDIPEGIGEVVAEITYEKKEHLVIFQDEAQQAEAVKILHSIFDLREEQQQRESPDGEISKLVHSAASISLCLYMLYYILNNKDKALTFQTHTGRLCNQLLDPDLPVREHYNKLSKVGTK